jgi:hypothetical protein
MNSVDRSFMQENEASIEASPVGSPLDCEILGNSLVVDQAATITPRIDQPDPRDEAVVRLANDLDTIVGMIQKYFSLPHPAVAMLIACWIANTYIYKAFRYVGYLTLRSATPRCGKTRLLRLIGELSAGAPRPTTSPTAAVLYRGKREVLLLDEVDGLRNKDKETHSTIVAVLNAGFEEGGMIERLEKDEKGNFIVQEFPVFGPKALAGIESLTDTLADRAFVVDMYRAHQRMPRLNMKKLNDTFRAIRERLAKWAEVHKEVARAHYARPIGWTNRFQERRTIGWDSQDARIVTTSSSACWMMERHSCWHGALLGRS